MSAGGRTSLARHAAGLAVAPLVAPLLVVGVGLIEVVSRQGPRAHEFAHLHRAIAIATSVAPFSYAAALVLGVPILVSLRAARRLSVPWVVVLAAAVGAVSLAAVSVALELHAESNGCASDTGGPLLGGLLAGAVLGALMSALHCAIARVPLREARPEPARPASGGQP